MKLSSIVPWGRSLDEYRGMFALSPADLGCRMLDCGGGPASFNAEGTALGARIVSVDPLYAYAARDIERRIEETFDTVMFQAQAQADRFVWRYFADPKALGHARRAAMLLFLGDYEAGKQVGRYVEGALPNLPFANGSFDLALSSHLLFLYSDHLSLSDHLAGVRELLRVAGEVRLFPLDNLAGERSPHLAPVCEALRRDGHAFEEVKVAYEFQRGAHSMLRVRGTSR
jgi:SAM-dependent methyltransferase